MTDTISDNTKVPISLVRWLVATLIGIFAMCVGAARWAYSIDNGLSNVNEKLDQANQRMTAVVSELRDLNNDSWTRSDMRTWSENLQDRNPSLSVPRIKDDR